MPLGSKQEEHGVRDDSGQVEQEEQGDLDKLEPLGDGHGQVSQDVQEEDEQEDVATPNHNDYQLIRH